MEKLLLIDDETSIRATIKQILEGPTLKVLTADSSEKGIEIVCEESPFLVLLDIRLGKESGLDVFHRLRSIDPRILIVFITGHGSAELTIEAMKLGAFDYLVKPLDLEQLHQVINQARKINRLVRMPAAVETDSSEFDVSDRLVGNSPAMQAVCKQIGRFAPQDVNVLVLGESGTGKELVARAIYQHSRRRDAGFLAINCAAIPETILESELFGHEKGAFTGADRKRIGKFEQCHGGTIFLDEIGDMPLATQAKILRLLQDGSFQRVGSNETLHADVRIIAATNQDLEKKNESGEFRRDLFYRLRGVTVQLSPLRERRDDIPELAHYFMFRFNRHFQTSVASIASETLSLLEAYHWPGNIRELQSVIREGMITATGPVLLPEFLPRHISERELAGEDITVSQSLNDAPSWEELRRFVEQALSGNAENVYRRALNFFDGLIIKAAMENAKGNQSKAAELLSLSRPTLRAKLRQLLKLESISQTKTPV